MTSTPTPDDELLTAEQVSEMLGVAENTLYRWRRLHERLPYYKLGSGGDRAIIRYRRSDVLAYLGENRVEADDTPDPTEIDDEQQTPPGPEA